MIDFFANGFSSLSYELVKTIIAFLFVLTLVVFIHELGHFLVARWAGVRVLTFSVGFGRELVGFTDRRGTRWKISLIPLGGYVKFFGDQSEASTPASDALEHMTEDERKVSFHHQPVRARAAIVAAGPIANFLLAIVLFTGLFMVYGKSIVAARVDGVVAGSVAEKAGFKPGDVITAIDGRTVDHFGEMQQIVSVHGGQPLTFTVKRAEQTLTLEATPQLVEEKDRFGNRQKFGRLGISRNTEASEPRTVAVGPVEALKMAVGQCWFIVETTLKFIGSLFQGRGDVEQLGGPIRIAEMSGQAASMGFDYLVNLAAALSVSIGLLNLFPVPLLDGGHLMFYLAEVIRGRPLSERTQEMGFRVGLALVLMLMIFTTYIDVWRLVQRFTS